MNRHLTTEALGMHLFDDERISKVNDANAAAELEVCCDDSCNVYVTLVYNYLRMLL